MSASICRRAGRMSISAGRARPAPSSARGRWPWWRPRWRSPAACRRGCPCADSPAVHRLGDDDQRVGRIEAARDADDAPCGCRWPPAAGRGPRPGCCRPRSNPARGAPGRPARTGSARSAGISPRSAVRRVEPERRRGDRRAGVRARALSSKLPGLQALLGDQVEVDVGQRRHRPVREALALGERARPARRCWSGRPRTGRWSIRPGPRRRRHTRRRRASRRRREQERPRSRPGRR